MNFDIKPIPLRPLVEQALQANLAYAKEYDVRLSLADSPEEVAALGDSDRLMQVLTNLLSNASKFSPKGGEVTVRIVPGEQSHRISVEDQGSGIPEEFKQRIFSKFAQADASDTREKGGTGLGFDGDIAPDSDQVRSLAASTTYSAILLDLALPGEEAIGLIGGLRSDPRYTSVPILIASSDGATGQVSQTLAVVDWLQQPIAPEKLVERVQARVEAGKRPCILHIEDDVDVLRVVASAFDGRADLHSVADIETARAALKKGRYDLVILDLALPGGSGLQLLPEMRREDGTPGSHFFSAG
jgi:DNA-binding response OmpR family regulator